MGSFANWKDCHRLFGKEEWLNLCVFTMIDTKSFLCKLVSCNYINPYLTVKSPVQAVEVVRWHIGNLRVNLSSPGWIRVNQRLEYVSDRTDFHTF